MRQEFTEVVEAGGEITDEVGDMIDRKLDQMFDQVCDAVDAVTADGSHARITFRILVESILAPETEAAS